MDAVLEGTPEEKLPTSPIIKGDTGDQPGDAPAPTTSPPAPDHVGRADARRHRPRGDADHARRRPTHGDAPPTPATPTDVRRRRPRGAARPPTSAAAAPAPAPAAAARRHRRRLTPAAADADAVTRPLARQTARVTRAGPAACPPRPARRRPAASRPGRPHLGRPGRRPGQRGGRRPLGPARGHRPGAASGRRCGSACCSPSLVLALAWIKQAPCAGRQLGGLTPVHALLLLRHRPAVRLLRPGHGRGALPGLARSSTRCSPAAFMALAPRRWPASTTALPARRRCCPTCRRCESYYVVTCLLLSLCALRDRPGRCSGCPAGGPGTRRWSASPRCCSCTRSPTGTCSPSR